MYDVRWKMYDVRWKRGMKFWENREDGKLEKGEVGFSVRG
jgi:hypothetical protein